MIRGIAFWQYQSKMVILVHCQYCRFDNNLHCLEDCHEIGLCEVGL